ncbi:MAG: DinB family protein [Thermoanaerobaculia bacterium]|nr:DinB family protein [Thermoanaerobaculia bacterium]
MAAPAIELLLAALDEAYDRRSWHGTNLRGALRGTSAAEAAWRPAPERHNTWELAVHCAYWKYAVRRRLAGTKRGSFRLAGSNWFPRPVPGADGEEAWRSDLRLLAEEHRALRAAVAGLAAGDLGRCPAGDGRRWRASCAGWPPTTSTMPVRSSSSPACAKGAERAALLAVELQGRRARGGWLY